MTFDRLTVRLIQSEINEALEKIAKKHNISLVTLPGSFNHNRLECKVVGMSADATDPAEEDYKAHEDFIVKNYGIPKGSLGKTFTVGRRTYKLTGYSPRATKNPFVCECRGKYYVLDATSVKIGLTQRPTKYIGF